MSGVSALGGRGSRRAEPLCVSATLREKISIFLVAPKRARVIILGEIKKHIKPVKLFCGILVNKEELFSGVNERLTKEFGEIDFQSIVFPFPHTNYYQKKMGYDIFRKWVSFKNLILPELLPKIKTLTNEVELEFSDEVGERLLHRRANIDPGYLNHSKVVLATTKDYDHRLYLIDGIYAEVTLHYKKSSKSYKPWQWTYPDYRAQNGLNFFNKTREIYIKNLKENEI